jgi:pimeloyl-ACP methyl ester carboxylesterase
MLDNLRRAAERPEVAALRDSPEVAELSRDPQQRRRARFAMAVAGYFVDPRRALELTPFIVQQRAEQAVWASLGDYDLRPRLPSLRGLPSLVAHGNQDPIPIATARETAALLDATMVALDGCGHVPYIEAPEPLFAALASFLRA